MEFDDLVARAKSNFESAEAAAVRKKADADRAADIASAANTEARLKLESAWLRVARAIVERDPKPDTRIFTVAGENEARAHERTITWKSSFFGNPNKERLEIVERNSVPAWRLAHSIFLRGDPEVGPRSSNVMHLAADGRIYCGEHWAIQANGARSRYTADFGPGEDLAASRAMRPEDASDGYATIARSLAELVAEYRLSI